MPEQLKNDRLLRAIRRQPLDMTPVWIMRQAGRYLPEYRATREKAGSFMALCKTPELACEVTLQPLRRYPLDAAIIFSDILTIPDAMGLGLYFTEGKGPAFSRPLDTTDAVMKLTVPPYESLSYVYDSIRLVQHELAGKVPLIGFCGSPWTLVAYMLEGQSRPGFPRVRTWMQTEEATLRHLLQCLADAVALHLFRQVEAGVQVAMIFDTWGGLLDTAQYEQFSLYYVRSVISQLKTYMQTANLSVPIILFTKGGHRWLSQMADSGCDMLGIDWLISLQEARQAVGHRVALQGNLNPSILLNSPPHIEAEVDAVLASFGVGSGHVFNLGHGITPDVSPEHLAILIEAVHEKSKVYHQLALNTQEISSI